MKKLVLSFLLVAFSLTSLSAAALAPAYQQTVQIGDPAETVIQVQAKTTKAAKAVLPKAAGVTTVFLRIDTEDGSTLVAVHEIITDSGIREEFTVTYQQGATPNQIKTAITAAVNDFLLTNEGQTVNANKIINWGLPG